MSEMLFRPTDGRAVLLDAYAPWCGPCKLIEPYLEGCAEKYSDKLSVVKYDVEGDNNANLKVEMLLGGVMVRGLPTLVLYHDGNALATHSGVITEGKLEGWLEEHLFSVHLDDVKNSVVEKEAVAVVAAAKAKTTTAGQTTEEPEKDAAGSKRGFVSFGGCSELDDYMLASA